VSEDNVELHRRIYGSFNARDVTELLALCDPSITVQSVFAAVGGAVYRGHAPLSLQLFFSGLGNE
jgi:hypothetical protein